MEKTVLTGFNCLMAPYFKFVQQPKVTKQYPMTFVASANPSTFGPSIIASKKDNTNTADSSRVGVVSLIGSSRFSGVIHSLNGLSHCDTFQL